ncbi:MAG: prepilin-type N-terminal cleavage/methylation domain-containing protein [Deltaproteobacteria bacterium]|nr:prepilin-type N-terminal cleavage/methylation domain-containing protein [Deltaproteobacteria bacterium]MBN2673465.1 prepilin-type N-terminal cleavage/methylation domain-containing protein [Deltaproteobacteria bacterium]
MTIRRGFTLLEIMVSLAVTGMISIAIWAATSQTTKARNIVEYSQDNFHQVRVAFDMLNRDISSAFLSYHRAPQATHDTIFIGTDGGNEDSIDFASFSHNRRYFDVDESDQAEVSYFLATDPENSDMVNLVRRESPILDTKPLEGGQTLVLVHNVAKFDLQYYDIANKEWQDEWDTTQAAGEGTILPTQVRIKLVVNERRGASRINGLDEEFEEVTYGTQLTIPFRTPILLVPTFIPGMPLTVD